MSNTSKNLANNPQKINNLRLDTFKKLGFSSRRFYQSLKNPKDCLIMLERLVDKGVNVLSNPVWNCVDEKYQRMILNMEECGKIEEAKKYQGIYTDLIKKVERKGFV